MSNDTQDTQQRLESLMRLDPLDGPARPMPPAAASEMVDAVLDQWQAELPPPVRKRSPRWPYLAVAAVFVSGSVAAMWAVSSVPTPGKQPKPANRTSSPSIVTPMEPKPAVEQAPVEAATEQPDSPPAESTPAPRADDLLARANRLRGERRFAAAERTYRRVIRQHPRSSSAYVSMVAAASIRLEHLNDAAGGLALYKRATRSQPGGPLSLEVQEGIARAYRVMGRRDEEIQALRSLLDGHSAGPAVQRAQRRLRSLDGAH